METLKDASINITIPAPIHKAGNTEVIAPELGKNTKAKEDRIAPTKKKGFLLPILVQVWSL